MKKITAYTKNQAPHEVTDIIATGNAVDEESYWLIGIYVSNTGGPIFAVQADNEQDATEELAASKYGHFILIDNDDDLAEYEEMGVIHWTDAGPCYIEEPIAYMAKVDHWDEFTARDIAIKNLPADIEIELTVDYTGGVALTPVDKQERKWIAATNLYNHSADVCLQNSQEITGLAEYLPDAFFDGKPEEGIYSIGVDIYLNYVGGQLG